MSASIFPAMPGIVYSKVQRTPYFHTTVLKMWSGKEVRLGRQASAIVNILMRVEFVRDNVNCTTAPYTSTSELDVLKSFHSTMRGSLDTFHIADPDGGADIVVRFASDELQLRKVVDHVWEGEINLVTVL